MKKASIFYNMKELNKGPLNHQKNDFKARKTTLKYTDSGRERIEKNIKNPKKQQKEK